MRLTYASAGVDRRERSKAKALFDLQTQRSIATPFVNVFYEKEKCSSLLADGVGTKVLLAQLAGKHDTIGIDGVAMVANDAVRAGLEPKFLVDIIDVHHSEEKLVADLFKGIKNGAEQAGCAIAGGETADVPSLVAGLGTNPYNLNFSLYSECEKKSLITGRGLKPGDIIVGLRSSGLHSNGFSLVRRVLFKEWGGFYSDAFAEIDGLGEPLVSECLKPTRIYVKPVLGFHKKTHAVKAAIHVTGDAFAKFGKLFPFNRKVGLQFDNFQPQPIFRVLQETARKLGCILSDEEMLRTFNLGWGFALVLDKKDADSAIGFFEKRGFESAKIGSVTHEKGVIRARFKNQNFSLA